MFNLAVLAVGGVLLVLLLDRFGWTEAREILERVGAWFGILVALDLAALACDAAATHSFMRPEARMVSYVRVLAAQVSGRAINVLVPGGALGEATKISLLVGHAPRARVVSSIVLANLASFYLSVLIVLVGVPITLLLVDLPERLEVIVGVGLAILVPLILGLAWMIHRGAVGTVLDTARGLRLVSAERAARGKERLAEVDRHLRELQTHRSPGTRIGLLFVCLSRLLSWTALAILLHALGVPLHPALLVGVVSVGVLINWASSFVPFGLGIADGGNYLLYDVLGAAGAHGVLVTMISRARTIVLALLGLTVMAIAHTANRISLARRERHFDELRMTLRASPRRSSDR